MTASYVAALDQGTTSTRFIVFDRSGRIVTSAQKEHRQIYPQPGWVEHDPEEIASSQIAVALESLAQANAGPGDVAAIGIANQRETTIVWNRDTGVPVYNAIVWQDRRTAAQCNALDRQGLGETISDHTGLVIDPYFSATKIKWILDNVSGARARAEKGVLAFGTVDSWLIWHLTSGKRHVTDVTNASRTLLLNIYTGDWDDQLLALFDISELKKYMTKEELAGHPGAAALEEGH